MKKIFYRAFLIDEKINSFGAVLVKDKFIFAVIKGNFCNIESAKNLVTFFGDGETENSIEFIDCQQKILMPSFIDMHVHFRYPGQTQKEDLQSGLNAAVAGGFGTLVLMPNTNPVVSSEKLAHSIETEAAKFGKAQVIQSVSLTQDFDGKTTTHIDSLKKILLLTEDGNDVQDSNVMLEAMCKGREKNAIVSCHCEDKSFTFEAKNLRKEGLVLFKKYDTSSKKDNEILVQAESCMKKANHLLALAEDLATERNVQIAKQAGCKIHLAHVSTAKSIEILRRAKKDKELSITCEVTPHHFSLSTQNNFNLRYIVNPPIRQETDRQAILQAFKDGLIDVISTDHAPHTLEDKINGSPGFPGLETSFSVACTNLVQEKIINLQQLSMLMSSNPAKILGFSNSKGRLLSGYKADLVLVDPEKIWTVDSSKFFTKGKTCPFEGQKLKGKVLSTWFGGKKVF